MRKTLSILLALCMVLPCFAFAEEAAPTYTYNLALSEFPTNWNIHQYKTSTDAEIADWITAGFYAFDYNDTMDGYKIVPEMATDFPVDVSAQYVGDKWGIAEGDVHRAWAIPLRQDLKWQDGTPINAYDFVNSYKMLLNPTAANYRADGLWTGNMVITGSEMFFKQNSEADTKFGTIIDMMKYESMDAFIAAYADKPGLINWNYSFGDTYDFAAQAWTGAAENKVVETGLTVAELYAFFTEGAGAAYATWASPENLKEWAFDELYAKFTYPEMDFADVGVVATGDYELTMIIDKPLVGFYLLYALTSNYLVNEAMYTACESVVDGVYTNTYGTAAENTMSYYAYMLTSFQSDKQFVLEKNPYWYGWNDEENANAYQTTKIQYDYVKEPETRLEMFLNGQLDAYGLNANNMADYATSEHTYYSLGDSVFAMVFNPNLEALATNQVAVGENINKTIITIKEFRVAMSLAMNRAEFCLATAPTNGPAFAIYGARAVSDPDNGISYRTTDAAKKVIVDFWGLTEEIGEGKIYPTVDDAIDAITGYNLAMAQENFNIAYDKAIEAGLMDEDDVIQIMVGTPNATSVFYNNGYDFIVNNYTEAVKGTKLEGKLTFTRDSTLGNGYADALRNNQVDMLFGVGWTGSTFDPYGLMQVYVDPNYQYDRAYDATTTMVEIALENGIFTASAKDWYNAMQGNKIAAKVKDSKGQAIAVTIKDGVATTELAFPYSTDAHEAEQRMLVLAAMENAILQNYNFIPLMNNATATLKGMQVEFFTEDERFPMGRGGVRFMTYNYSDAEWDEYVASQGGTLQYK